MGTGMALSVVETLLAACSEESGLVGFQHTVNTVKCVLLDAQDREAVIDNYEQVELYIQRLRDAVYDADDIVDELVTLAQQKSLKSLLKDGKVSEKVNKIKKMLDVIVKNYSEFIGVPAQHMRMRMRREETYSHVNESNIVGREDDVDAIVHLLLDYNGKKGVSFLPIVGIGGLGKTALAQLVLNDNRIRSAFELSLWICVSDHEQKRLDVEGVLRKICASLVGKKDEGSTMDMLISQLRQKLDGKKYLLVLDDVWTENRSDWHKLVDLLWEGREGSWIVVTTRSHETARIVGGGPIHELQGLSEESSWLLFERIAFGSEQSNLHDDLVQIGRKIVDECGGVPLAIRATGNSLCGQDKSKWLSFQKTGLSNLRYSHNDIMPILKLSYDQLESPLKGCLSYCALFPRDYVIEKELLISLWIAQGFIVPVHEGQGVDDIAEKYFSILLARGFFQDARLDEYDEISSCGMHVLMRDVAQHVAGKEICVTDSVGKDLHEKVRHIALIRGASAIHSFTKAQIRSYLSFGIGCGMQQQSVEALVANWVCLRALDLSRSNFRSLTNSIGKLLHLRYLDLSENYDLEMLPKPITKLHNLETLKLARCSSLKELPRDLCKLVKLRVLDLKDCRSLTHMPRDMGKLRCLHTLSRFVVISASWMELLDELEELKGLKSLKGTLYIFINLPCNDRKMKQGYKREGAYLRTLEHLSDITIDFDGTVEEGGEEALGLVESLQPHSNVKMFCLKGFNLRKQSCARGINLKFPPHSNLIRLELLELTIDQVTFLGMLPHLKTLLLNELSELKYMIDSSAMSEASCAPTASTPGRLAMSNVEGLSLFPSLEVLYLVNLPKFEGWKRSRMGVEDNNQLFSDTTGSMEPLLLPGLKKLSIYSCPVLKGLSLQKLGALDKELGDGKNLSSRTLSSSSSIDIPNSRAIEIDDVRWLDLLPTEAFLSLNSLKLEDKELKSLAEIAGVIFWSMAPLRELRIKGCSNLRSISGGLEHLISLEILEIDNCPNLSLSEVERQKGIDTAMPYPSFFHSLRCLILDSLPQLVDLPNWMQFLTTLQTLQIRRCHRLESLPNWMHKLTCLRELELSYCSASLKERCQASTGDNWHLIQHIPRVEINEAGIAEITAASSDATSLARASGRKQDFEVSGSMDIIAGRMPATDSVITHGLKIQIESDVDTHSSAAELVETSHDLDSETNISAAASASEPSGKIAVKPELISPSSRSTSIRVREKVVKAADQREMWYDADTEPQMSGPSLSEYLSGDDAVRADVTTTSVETDGVILNEAVGNFSFQAETSETGEVLPIRKVDIQQITSSGEIDSSVQNEAIGMYSIHVEENEIDEVLPRTKVDVNRPIRRTVDKILEAFKDDRRRRICLYGRGGSGKTTVLNNLFLHPAAKELFDQILQVTVPRFAYQEHVRDEIVRQLSINVREACSDVEISSLIHQALVDKKCLLLLDDVCESINLHEVGIPPDAENSCWCVLATRSLDVCQVMTDMEIGMEVLSNAEALQLFYCQVGDIIDSPEIKPFAQAISEQCYGSPVIISAMGSALRAESNVEEWKLALKNLQFRNTVYTNDQCSFRCHIKYCYDRLTTRDMKTCFLYTALCQKEKEIDSSALVESFVSEGLVGGRTTAAYRKGHDIVGHLKTASLLEANDNGLMVKMHSIVRDSALEILSSDAGGFQESSWITKLVNKTNTSNIQLPSHDKYLTRAGAHLKIPPSIKEWEQATMIFLMDNEISSLPSKPNCSTLVALLLQRNLCLRTIPPSFFDSMSTLRILNLSKTRIKSLPNSFSMLISLQILLLRDCERLLMLPPSIGTLKYLEVLDLQGTEVTHLPDSAGELANLKELRISFYGSMNQREYNKLPLKLVSDGIISSLGLRVLVMFVYPGDQRWTLSASSITKEISSLKLSVLYFHFTEVESLEYFVHASQTWKDRDVTTFNFVVGRDFKRIVSLVSDDAELLYNDGQRCLRFVNGEDVPDAVVEVLSRATCFYLDHHLSICYLSQFGSECFDGLKCCILSDCPNLVEIVNSEEHGREFFPVLEYLSMNCLRKLERLWVGHAAMGSLARLRCLSVHACPKLSYVFTCSMLDILSNLEELVIEDCVSLLYVVIKDDDVEKMRNLSSASDKETVKLKQFSPCGFSALHNLKVLKLHYLPEMCGIWRTRWPPLEYMSFYNCPKLRNLHMEENVDAHIKQIAADKIWWDSLEWEDPVLSRRLHKFVTEIHIDEL